MNLAGRRANSSAIIPCNLCCSSKLLSAAQKNLYLLPFFLFFLFFLPLICRADAPAGELEIPSLRTKGLAELFDEDVREPSQTSIPNDYPMEGRSFRAGLRYTF